MPRLRSKNGDDPRDVWDTARVKFIMSFLSSIMLGSCHCAGYMSTAYIVLWSGPPKSSSEGNVPGKLDPPPRNAPVWGKLDGKSMEDGTVARLGNGS